MTYNAVFISLCLLAFTVYKTELLYKTITKRVYML